MTLSATERTWYRTAAIAGVTFAVLVLAISPVPKLFACTLSQSSPSCSDRFSYDSTVVVHWTILPPRTYGSNQGATYFEFNIDGDQGTVWSHFGDNGTITFTADSSAYTSAGSSMSRWRATSGPATRSSATSAAGTVQTGYEPLGVHG